MEVNTRFGSTSFIATFEPAIECARSENARPKIDTPHSNRLLSQRDPDFRFQKGRLADSLKKRAELRLKANE